MSGPELSTHWWRECTDAEKCGIRLTVGAADEDGIPVETEKPGNEEATCFCGKPYGPWHAGEPPEDEEPDDPEADQARWGCGTR